MKTFKLLVVATALCASGLAADTATPAMDEDKPIQFNKMVRVMPVNDKYKVGNMVTKPQGWDWPDLPNWPDLPDLPDWPDWPDLPDWSDWLDNWMDNIPDWPDSIEWPEWPDLSGVPSWVRSGIPQGARHGIQLPKSVEKKFKKGLKKFKKKAKKAMKDLGIDNVGELMEVLDEQERRRLDDQGGAQLDNGRNLGKDKELTTIEKLLRPGCKAMLNNKVLRTMRKEVGKLREEFGLSTKPEGSMLSGITGTFTMGVTIGATVGMFKGSYELGVAISLSPLLETERLGCYLAKNAVFDPTQLALEGELGFAATLMKSMDDVAGASTTLSANLDICDILTLPAGPQCSFDTGVNIVFARETYKGVAGFLVQTVQGLLSTFTSFMPLLSATDLIGMGLFVEAGTNIGIDPVPLIDASMSREFTYLYEVEL